MHVPTPLNGDSVPTRFLFFNILTYLAAPGLS